VRLFLGDRAVLDATRDDEQVAGLQVDVAVPELDSQAPGEQKERLLLVVVNVPGRGADALGDLEQVAVGMADNALRPELGELVRDGRRVDRVRLRLCRFHVWYRFLVPSCLADLF
jgi:hypothetical protein